MTNFNDPDTIRKLVGVPALMSLGASNLREHHPHKWSGLQFTARILPFRKDGQRGTAARMMLVTIDWYEPDENYSVIVTRMDNGDNHYRGSVVAEHLARLMLALDFDGHELLNPRLAVDMLVAK